MFDYYDITISGNGYYEDIVKALESLLTSLKKYPSEDFHRIEIRERPLIAVIENAD